VQIFVLKESIYYIRRPVTMSYSAVTEGARLYIYIYIYIYMRMGEDKERGWITR